MLLVLSYKPIPWIFYTESHYVAQAVLELRSPLPLPPECWDYRCMYHIWPIEFF
jgi:hypothetical protein